MKTLQTPAMKAARTSIARTRPALPVRELQALGLLEGRILDHGSGRGGSDAGKLGFVHYDPEFFPKKPKGTFDTVISCYVLNVLPKEREAGVLLHALRFLKRSGTLYVVVRRDVKKDGITRSGTFQRDVVLEGPQIKTIVERRGKYAIYAITIPCH